MNREAERQRARTLRAADAGDLLRAKLPFVFKHLGNEHIDQVQRLLDAVVLNPVIEKEVAELDRKSIRSQSGNLVHRDPDMVRRRDQKAQEYIDIKKLPKMIRLDPFEKLLAPDAFKPVSDNPDEAAYLLVIKKTLAYQGVWLRYKVGIFKDRPTIVYDSRTFEAWLSLGPDLYADVIPTPDGRLTRAALLKTTNLGSGYWEQVHNGQVDRLMKSAIDRIQAQVRAGMLTHGDRSILRNGVASRVSDFVGGADFPDMKIWDAPHRTAIMAHNQKNNDKFGECAKYLVIASVETAVAAEKLQNYIAAATKGASRVVKFLEILQVAGRIAEAVLVVRMLARGIYNLLRSGPSANGASGGAGARRLPSGGGTGAKKEPPPVTHRPGVNHPTNYDAPEGYARTLQQAGENVTLHTTAGTAVNRYDLATQRRAQNWLDEYRGWLRANPDASMADKLAAMDRVDARWGGDWTFPN